MKLAIRSLLFSAFLGASAIALAGSPGDEPPKRTVQFADLDLTRPTGAAVLYGRIRSAARQVCQPAIASDLGSMTFVHRCMEQAIARAVDDVNAPQLTSYYRGQVRPPALIARR